MTPAERFRALHHTPEPLVLPNAWDPVSARIIAESNYPAVATSSGAVARVLGYDDGELTPPDEMFTAVARIARAVPVPVTADLEAGYGLAPKEFAERALAAGVAGCNLEDSRAGKLLDPAAQAEYLADVRAAAGADLVVNARVDVFVVDSLQSRDELVADAIERGRAYRRAGADCVYPIAAPLEVLAVLAREIGGPFNAHASVSGPSVAELAGLGATRISYGTSLHNHTMQLVRDLLPGLITSPSSGRGT